MIDIHIVWSSWEYKKRNWVVVSELPDGISVQATMGRHASSNSACSAEFRYQYQGCLASIVNRAKMPSCGASMFAQFTGGFADPATPSRSLAVTQSGVVESIIAPLASNCTPLQTAGSGLRSATNRA